MSLLCNGTSLTLHCVHALMLVIDTQLLNDSRLVEPVLEFLNILPKVGHVT